MSKVKNFALLAGASLCLVVFNASMALSASDENSTKTPVEARKIVDKAEKAVETMKQSPQSDTFRNALDDAAGVVIVPDFYKGGFIVGGATGEGVMLTRDADAGTWSDPAFYRLSSGSLGFQAGFKESELVLVVLSEDALNKLKEDKITLGAEGGIAVAKIGAGMGASSTSNVDADVVAFTKSEGAFAGVSLEGSVLSTDEELNEAYYGKPMTTNQILDGTHESWDDADPLRNAL